MTTIRMMIWIAAGLLIGSLFTPSAWAEGPPSTPREREIKEHEAQYAKEHEAQYAKEYEGQVEEARAKLEQAEQQYRQMAQHYEQAQTAYEEGRALYNAGRDRSGSLEAVEARASDLEKQLHELRLREVELEAMMQQMEISGRQKDVQGLQSELIELHRQSQMTMLELEQQHGEQGRIDVAPVARTARLVGIGILAVLEGARGVLVDGEVRAMALHAAIDARTLAHVEPEVARGEDDHGQCYPCPATHAPVVARTEPER